LVNKRHGAREWKMMTGATGILAVAYIMKIIGYGRLSENYERVLNYIVSAAVAIVVVDTAIVVWRALS